MAIGVRSVGGLPNVASWLRTAVQATPLLRPLYLRQLTFDFELPLFDLSFRFILQLQTILTVPPLDCCDPTRTNHQSFGI
ncbi:MAG: hypothetical protein ACTSX7_11475 [Alphaproteobacteria bacterium]